MPELLNLEEEEIANGKTAVKNLNLIDVNEVLSTLKNVPNYEDFNLERDLNMVGQVNPSKENY